MVVSGLGARVQIHRLIRGTCMDLCIFRFCIMLGRYMIHRFCGQWNRTYWLNALGGLLSKSTHPLSFSGSILVLESVMVVHDSFVRPAFVTT